MFLVTFSPAQRSGNFPKMQNILKILVLTLAQSKGEKEYSIGKKSKIF